MRPNGHAADHCACECVQCRFRSCYRPRCMPLGVRIIHWSWGNGEITAVGVTIVPMTDSRVSIAPWSAHDTVSIALADGSAVHDWSNVELIQRCNECNLEDKTRLCRPIAGSMPELGTSPDWERPNLIIPPAVNSEPSMHVYPNGNAVATVSSHRSISQWKFLWIQAISNHFYVSFVCLSQEPKPQAEILQTIFL